MNKGGSKQRISKNLFRAASLLLSTTLLSGCASVFTRYGARGLAQQHRREHGELEQRYIRFTQQLGIPFSLSRFLIQKDSNIIIRKSIGSFPLRICEEVDMPVVGVYYGAYNKIFLNEDHSKSTLYHEIGHGLWDKEGADSIFENTNYAGPSRQEFIDLLKETREYQTQTGVMQSRAAKEIYCNLLGKLKESQQQQELSKFYSVVGGCHAGSFPSWADYAAKAQITFNEDRLEDRILNEAFAESFAQWMLGKSDTVQLFDAMRYNGKGWKED